MGTQAGTSEREQGMKLYDSKGAPNPRRVRIFLAEKGIAVPTEKVDIMAKQHLTPEYSAINPLQRTPALVLDDGTVITDE
jgi:glutathione S-transferase